MNEHERGGGLSRVDREAKRGHEASENRDTWGDWPAHVVAEGDPSAVGRASAARTRRSFLVGGVGAAAGYGLWHWIDNSPPVGRLQAVLRRSLLLNARFDRRLFDERGLAPVYPLREAAELRLNGIVGLERTLVPKSWRLQVAGVAHAEASPHFVPDVTAWNYEYGGDVPGNAQTADVKSAPGGLAGGVSGGSASSGSASGGNIAERFDRMAQALTHKRYQGDAEAGASSSSLNIGTPGLLLTMASLAQLPKVEMVTQFKCVEGWSQITQWAGYRLRDFMEAYPPARVDGREPRYVYMETPDGNYYAGYNMSAARHPQSLLVTEMGGRPLTQAHGAPLRLYMPIKYGYKQLKRIGLIAYMDNKPDDYWTKLGYDWYAGL